MSKPTSTSPAAGSDSHETPTPHTEPTDASPHDRGADSGRQEMGQVTERPASGVAESSGAGGRARDETRAEATDRWRREGRKAWVEEFREQVRRECVAARMSGYEAKEEAWRRALAEFPPPGVEPAPQPPLMGVEGLKQPLPSQARGESGVRGLADIPADWPPLPDNAALAAEIAWVQAQRLRVVEGEGDSVTVHLDRAGAPAPSWAALGWLETSIRAYSKYCDIASKATAGQDDEAALTRREHLAIEEIQGLLAEMEADKCPHCGGQL